MRLALGIRHPVQVLDAEHPLLAAVCEAVQILCFTNFGLVFATTRAYQLRVMKQHLRYLRPIKSPLRSRLSSR
jgi:hypothetical protein